MQPLNSCGAMPAGFPIQVSAHHMFSWILKLRILNLVIVFFYENALLNKNLFRIDQNLQLINFMGGKKSKLVGSGFVKTCDELVPGMYQTIRVIRPQPQQPTPASLLRDMPNGNLLVFAVIAGVGGSSLFYLLSKPGFLGRFHLHSI